MIRCLLLVLAALLGSSILPSVVAAETAYVGQHACAGCHRDAAAAWQGSQHAQAMQEATETTVLGRFDGATLSQQGITTTFFRRDGRFFVNTDGPDGQLADFAISHTFGIAPLQQYLVSFPDGRRQALPVAWDSRPAEQGGQRWFYLYPDERIDHRDPLHWTRLNQNWNYMCAECHSTDVQRRYDPATDRYATTWSDISVACEACHGPGADHIVWAKQRPGWEQFSANKGLTIQLNERLGVVWNADAASGNAQRSQVLTSQREVDTCARCHARRAALADGFAPGGPLLATHDPALLTTDLYFADGQQQDEVYTYGSFLQSKMYAHGVTCSDCHEPHSGKLRATGDAVCSQCHQPARYAASSHTLHAAGTPGAQCVACHMPTRTYMAIDPRHDHSLRIPRPDLSAQLATPNACNNCHQEQSAAWAAAVIEQAFGPVRKGFQNYAATLHAARNGAPGAAEQLVALAQNASAPVIARATALAELQRYSDPALLPVLRTALAAAEPLLRGAALDTLLYLPTELRPPLAAPLLNDPLATVRSKAARALAAVPLDSLTPAQRSRYEQGFAEYRAAQQASAERPEAYSNLGLFYAERQDAGQAEAAYRTALQRQPDFAPAYLNLADLYRLLGRETDADTTLATGLRQVPNDADLLHAQGLLRVRQGRTVEAVALLARAAAARPEQARYAYVYGIALHDSGRAGEAQAVLQTALRRFPYDRDILYALAVFAHTAGDRTAAVQYAKRLALLAPDDPHIAELVRQLNPH